MAMLDAAKYSAVEELRGGVRIEIRALEPDDQGDLVAAVHRISTHSLYRRFFGVRRNFTQKEIDFFVNVDFINHVALVAVAQEEGRAAIIAGSRYVVVHPGSADVAFAVIDEYQGRGIGGALMRHLVTIARGAGLEELTADVLAENAPMLKVFANAGLDCTTQMESGVVHLTCRLS
jgi:GNAT superfamily N-acetyltransferase